MIHGTVRKQKKDSPEEIQKSIQLSARVSKALQDFLKLRKGEVTVPDPYQATTVMLKLCPQIPTIFNYRCELILGQANSLQQQDYFKLLNDNLMLSAKLLRQNPKSYTIWTFRQWLVQQINDREQKEQKSDCLAMELRLCEKMLQEDQRNFHVWNYRNWVNQVSPNVERELKFYQTKLEINPSNFSAYHFKIKALTTKYRLSNIEAEQITEELLLFGVPKELFLQDLEAVKQIIFIDPREKGPWHYYEWLINLITPVVLVAAQQNPKQQPYLTLTFNKSITSPFANLGLPLEDSNQFRFSWRVGVKQRLRLAPTVPSQRGLEEQFGGKLVRGCLLQVKEGSVEIIQDTASGETVRLCQQQLSFLEELQEEGPMKARLEHSLRRGIW